MGTAEGKWKVWFLSSVVFHNWQSFDSTAMENLSIVQSIQYDEESYNIRSQECQGCMLH